MRVLSEIVTLALWVISKPDTQGTWTEDGSQTSKALESLREKGLAEEGDDGMWILTEAGKDMVTVLDVMES